MELRRFIPLLVLVTGLAAYHNSFRVPFIFDDYNAIVDNPHVRTLWPPWEAMIAPPQGITAGRPVAALTLALNYAVSGLHPWSYHAFNLAVHLANALLLLGILRRTLAVLGGATYNGAVVAITLLWLAHPLLTESVTYISQRTELLMAFFLLLTLYCVIRDWQLGAVVACALGMGCKEVMAVTPFVVLLYDRAFLAGSFREAFRQRGKLYTLLAATWLVLVASVAGGARSQTVGMQLGDVTPWRYALTQCGVILHYLRLSVRPHALVIDYNDWPVARGLASVWPAALTVGALLGATAWTLWRKPRIGFLAAGFFLVLAPTSSFVPIVTEVVAERRMYLPLAAVVSLAVLGAERLSRRVPIAARVALAGFVVLVFGALTVARNNDYRSEETIWRDAVTKRPGNVRALVNLGTVIARAGGTDEALALYRRALEIEPDNADVHFNLGVTLAGQRNTAEALPHLREAVRRVPQSARAQYSLGVVLAQRGDLADAATHLAESVKLNPRGAEAHNSLGGVLARQGNLADAEHEFNEALRLRADFADAHANLGFALAQQGKLDDAVRQWETALRIDPGNQGVRHALEQLREGK